MPVLILLIYYMHDLFLLQRYYSQTEFVAYQAVQMIQSISQNRSSKAITSTDLKYIFSAAFLSIYPDNNFSSLRSGHKHGHWGEIFMYYVKGNNDGTASVMWGIGISVFSYGSVTNSPSAVRAMIRETNNKRSHITIAQNVSPQTIYPKLKIGKNEVKIILETCLDYAHNSEYKLGDGSRATTVPYEKIFGFYLIKPKYTGRIAEERTCFNSIVVFSPNPDLFTETPPQPLS